MRSIRARATAALGAAALIAMAGTGTAAADPIGAGTASAYAITAALAGTEVVPPTPTAAVTAPPFGEDQNQTAVPIAADPLAISGTLTAKAAVHEASDLPSTLEYATQSVEGPYNARAVGEVEDLSVLINEQVPGGTLVDAALIRGEVTAKCVAGAVQYSANSEVLHLAIGGQAPLDGPLNDLISQITTAISDSPLAQIVDVDANVVTDLPGGGKAVDALVVTVLAAAGDPPVAQVRIGHAELDGVTCGGARPQCSDTTDNDGDAKVDAADPGCHTDGNADNAASYDPSDDSEADATQCADAKDNDGDAKVDAADPGCHTDGNADNAASYDPADNSEADAQGALPKTADTANTGAGLPATGTSVATGAAVMLGLGGLALFALRRRLA